MSVKELIHLSESMCVKYVDFKRRSTGRYMSTREDLFQYLLIKGHNQGLRVARVSSRHDVQPNFPTLSDRHPRMQHIRVSSSI